MQRFSFKALLTRAILTLALITLSAAPSFAQNIDDIVKKGKLTIGMLVDLPPFGLMTDGKPDGYDADVAKLMAKYLGVDLEIVPGQVAAVASSAGRSQFVTSYF